VRNIAGDVIAAYRQHTGMPDIPINVNGQVGCAAANVADHHAHLPLGFRKHHLGRRQRVQHKLRNFNPGCIHALPQVFHRRFRRGDDVGFHFQPVAVHPQRGANAALPVNHKSTLNHMDNLTVVRDGYRLGCFQRTGHVFLVNGPARNTHHAVAVDRGHMRPRQAHQC